MLSFHFVGNNLQNPLFANVKVVPCECERADVPYAYVLAIFVLRLLQMMAKVIPFQFHSFVYAFVCVSLLRSAPCVICLFKTNLEEPKKQIFSWHRDLLPFFFSPCSPHLGGMLGMKSKHKIGFERGFL